MAAGMRSSGLTGGANSFNLLMPGEFGDYHSTVPLRFGSPCHPSGYGTLSVSEYLGVLTGQPSAAAGVDVRLGHPSVALKTALLAVPALPAIGPSDFTLALIHAYETMLAMRVTQDPASFGPGMRCLHVFVADPKTSANLVVAPRATINACDVGSIAAIGNNKMYVCCILRPRAFVLGAPDVGPGVAEGARVR